MTEATFQKLVQRYMALYLKAGQDEKSALLALGDDYDRWMVKEFLPAFGKMASFKAGRLVADADSTAVIQRALKLVAANATVLVVAPATTWTKEYFPRFYTAGLRLYGLNQQINDLPAPRSMALRADDRAVIKTVIAAEEYTWRENLGHHVREMARKLQNAIFTGATLDELGAQLTCPDTHILGIRYGNSRVSWWEVLRRYGVNRPRTLAAMALRRRAVEYARSITPGQAT